MTTESLTDMEVILDFLEEQYGETDGDGCQKLEEIFMTREQPVNDTYEQYLSHWEFNKDIKQEVVMSRELPVDDTYMYEQYCSHWEFNPRLDDATEAFTLPHADTSLSGPVPSSVLHARQPSKPHTKTAGGERGIRGGGGRGEGGGGGGKLRLFRFLFEVLEDPSMAHCISWVVSTTGSSADGGGVFRFSSRNKEQVAALWGQRKGNKRPMTYQKMSRALRNYARSGQIFKVKKKLTYQFSGDTLRSLQQSCHHRHL